MNACQMVSISVGVQVWFEQPHLLEDDRRSGDADPAGHDGVAQDGVAGIAARLRDGGELSGSGLGVAAVVQGNPFARVHGRVGGGGFTTVDRVDGDRSFGAFGHGGQFTQHFKTLRELGPGGLEHERGQRGGGFLGSTQPVHAVRVGQLRCCAHERNVTDHH